MAAESLTVQLPSTLYTRLEERARQTRRSIEEELVDALVEVISVDDALPAGMADELMHLSTMSDAALWQVARTSHLSPAAAAHLEELNHKRQREGLDADEQQMAQALLHQYERAMLVRAEATVRLKERGHDVSSLLRSTTE